MVGLKVEDDGRWYTQQQILNPEKHPAATVAD